MKRVLIVDDDRNMHVLYEDLFLEQQKEYQLRFAISVENAIDIMRQTEFDLVILDIVMEPLSGQYLLLKLREDKNMKNTQIPVIIVSVLDAKELDFLKKLYNVHIFQKPLNIKKFTKIVEEMIV
jgi:cyclic di-GMP phosphodiesterase